MYDFTIIYRCTDPHCGLKRIGIDSDAPCRMVKAHRNGKPAPMVRITNEES